MIWDILDDLARTLRGPGGVSAHPRGVGRGLLEDCDASEQRLATPRIGEAAVLDSSIRLERLGHAVIDRSWGFPARGSSRGNITARTLSGSAAALASVVLGRPRVAWPGWHDLLAGPVPLHESPTRRPSSRPGQPCIAFAPSLARRWSPDEAAGDTATPLLTAVLDLCDLTPPVARSLEAAHRLVGRLLDTSAATETFGWSPPAAATRFLVRLPRFRTLTRVAAVLAARYVDDEVEDYDPDDDRLDIGRVPARVLDAQKALYGATIKPLQALYGLRRMPPRRIVLTLRGERSEGPGVTRHALSNIAGRCLSASPPWSNLPGAKGVADTHPPFPFFRPIASSPFVAPIPAIALPSAKVRDAAVLSGPSGVTHTPRGAVVVASGRLLGACLGMGVPLELAFSKGLCAFLAHGDAWLDREAERFAAASAGQPRSAAASASSGAKAPAADRFALATGGGTPATSAPVVSAALRLLAEVDEPLAVSLHRLADCDPASDDGAALLDGTQTFVYSEMMRRTTKRSKKAKRVATDVPLVDCSHDLEVNAETRHLFVRLTAARVLLGEASADARAEAEASVVIGSTGDGPTTIATSKLLRAGLVDSLPPPLLAAADGPTLQRLCNGVAALDVSALKAAVQCDSSDRVVGWFWDAMRGLPDDEVRKVWLFWTGERGIPAAGFGHAASGSVPSIEVRPITAQYYGHSDEESLADSDEGSASESDGSPRGASVAASSGRARAAARDTRPSGGRTDASQQLRLPTSMTCARALYLPRYESRSQLLGALRKLLDFHEEDSFGFA